MINKKWCWVATETNKGWRVRLAYGSKNYNVVGLILSQKEIIKVTGKRGEIVFIHLKNK